mmetsp:Transcript_18719/g.24715  ORF Transcript_18719/g.24715 Transcript_18719/m.24715 type:complete len:407 (+) Transcript_18719:43-1263(+)
MPTPPLFQLMFIYFLLFLSFSQFLSLEAEIEVDEHGILILNDANFEAVIKKEPLIMVEFYAPWCGFCKKFEPHFIRAAEILKDHDIPLAKVDATANEELYWSFNVQSFPTLKVFVDGEEINDFSGERSADSVVSHMLRRQSPLIEIEDMDDLEELNEKQGKHPLVLVASFEINSAILNAARKFDRLNFAVTSSSQVIDDLGLKIPSVTVLREFDGGPVSFTSFEYPEKASTKRKLMKFIYEKSSPLIIEFGGENAEWLWEERPGFDLHALFFVDKTAPYFIPLENLLRKLAEKYFGKFTVVIADVNLAADLFSNTQFELKLDELPECRVVYSNSRQRSVSYFKPPEKFAAGDEEALFSFFDQLLSGDYKAYHKIGPDISEAQDVDKDEQHDRGDSQTTSGLKNEEL